MRKVFLVVLCMFLAICMVACGNNTGNGESNPQSTEQTSDTEFSSSNETESNPEPIIEDNYDSFTKVSGKNIYVNYKEGRRDDNKSSTIVFHSAGSDLTVLSFDTSGDFSGELSNVLPLINDGRILRDISSYSDADFHDYNNKYLINVKSIENVEINGFSAQKFTGDVTSTDNRNCYVYGYALVVDSTPCVLAGFVLTESQENSLITSINSEVEMMIKTIRTER